METLFISQNNNELKMTHNLVLSGVQFEMALEIVLKYFMFGY